MGFFFCGEGCKVSLLPREPPGFFREKCRSEFSFLLEALEGGQEQEKLLERVSEWKWKTLARRAGVSGSLLCQVAPPVFILFVRLFEWVAQAVPLTSGNTNPSLEAEERVTSALVCYY